MLNGRALRANANKIDSNATLKPVQVYYYIEDILNCIYFSCKSHTTIRCLSTVVVSH